MNDIKKPSRNLRYSESQTRQVPIIRSSSARSLDSASVRNHKSILNKKVQAFEESLYDDEDGSSVENFYNRSSEKNIRNRVLNKSSHRKLTSAFKVMSAVMSALIIIFLLATYVFNSATIEIIPKVFNTKVNLTTDFVNTENIENYQIIEVKKEATKQIEKTEVKKTNAKAYGVITIYNNYNENSQRLVKNTRFESASGKIFRISDSVTVPGKTASGPGSVSVKVTADSFGSDYNIPLSKFKILGFKGTLRYDGFYAESKVAMTGGSAGESSSYSNEDIESADMILRSEIRELVKKDVPSIYKKDFSVIYDANFIDYSNNKDKLVSGADSKYTVFATAKFILIKDESIAKSLARKYINNYNEEKAAIQDLTKLKITVGSTTKDFKDNISINLLGDADLIMKIDENKLKASLVDKNNTKEEFINTLSKFTEIKQAVPKIFPPWVKTFPKNVNKIEIITKKE